MKPRTVSKLACATLAGMTIMATASDERMTVPVSFGRGLDTAQPGNTVNHAVLPQDIKVAQGGVVHFLVAGFHQLVVYRDGTQVRDIAVPSEGLFVNDDLNVRYKGIVPAGGPLATPATTSPSNAVNRLESISFTEPGTYLVICNVRQHFIDGMHATVQVLPRNN
ncbi:MAG TPA: hypothetical protein VHG88_14915 [Burkholderiales bacterium]|nr:hypothetical protein [Burkholderiales bacterium]